MAAPRKYLEGHRFESGVVLKKYVVASKGKPTFTCHCGNDFQAQMGAVSTGLKTHCGCRRPEPKTKYWKTQQHKHNFERVCEGYDFGNGVTFVARASGNKALVRCHCGREFVRALHYLLYSRVTPDCGCSNQFPKGHVFMPYGMRLIKYTQGPGTGIPGPSRADFRCRCGKVFNCPVVEVTFDGKYKRKGCGCTRRGPRGPQKNPRRSRKSS